MGCGRVGSTLAKSLEDRDHDVSVKSVVQRGIGDDARLVMVVHECRESNFAAAVAEIAGLDELRAPPRFIRVIEEEFV